MRGIGRGAILALMAIEAVGQLTKPVASPTIPVGAPTQSIGTVNPPAAVSPNLSAPSGLSVNPSHDFEVGRLTSIVPEYGHHIEVIEKDVSELKQKMWWTSGAAWAVSGLVAGLVGLFVAAWKPILRALIEEVSPRIVR